MITLNLGELGFILVIIGFILIFVSIIVMMLIAARGGEVKGGGAVLIGPFPIIFGDKEFIRYSFILLIIMVVFALIIMLLPILLTSYSHLVIYNV